MTLTPTISGERANQAGGAGMNLQPLDIAEAQRFVDLHHRHHHAPLSGKFAIGLNDGHGNVVGAAIVGRPVARAFDNGYTAEITRLCVLEGYKNACSMLYSACWRAARAMGYRRLITYIRWGHSKVVWTEGVDGCSSESYDYVAEVCQRRAQSIMRTWVENQMGVQS